MPEACSCNPPKRPKPVSIFIDYLCRYLSTYYRVPVTITYSVRADTLLISAKLPSGNVVTMKECNLLTRIIGGVSADSIAQKFVSIIKRKIMLQFFTEKGLKIR